MTLPMLSALPMDAAPPLNALVAAGSPAGQTLPHPADAQRFAQLLSGSASSAAPASAPAVSMAQVTRLLGIEPESSRSLQDLRAGMLASVDLRDPIGTMFALTDHSLEAHAMFARLHISSGLASAATSLFGTLLKNQS